MTSITFNQLCEMAFSYLERNPERFNDQEKVKFFQGLEQWISGKSDTIDDEVYDFLIAAKLSDQQSREEEFVSFLNQKHGHFAFKPVLDVGAGRMCRLSTLMAKHGAKMYAIDPAIRISDEEAYEMGLVKVSRSKFSCDRYPAYGRKGTNVHPFAHIVGLEPCEATEHIIRQGLKYDKPFDVLLCAAPHDSLDGKKFRSYEEWYEYLLKISSEVDITKHGSSYIISNDPQPFHELER